jgi:hypothetical protein
MTTKHERCEWRAGAALLVCLATGIAGCGREASTPAERSTDPQLQQPVTSGSNAAVTRSDLEGLTYSSEFAGPGRVTLLDGVYQEPVMPGAATVTLVLLTEHVAFGDLNADGVGDAVAVLETDPGGSGVFFELVAVVATDQGPRQVATESLGDRTDVEGVAIDDDGVVAIDLITHGPEDPMCCPTAREQRRYRLVGDSLLPLGADGEPALQQGHG